MIDELTFTDEEAREAAELANALDAHGQAAPDDLVALADLLQFSNRSPELSDRAEERILADLQRLQPRRGPRRWPALALAAGIAAVVAAGAWLRSNIPPPPVAANAIPSPQAPLISAQAGAIGAGSMEPLEHEMSLYRESLYGGLEARYGVKP